MSNPASEQARRATRALGLAEAFAPGPDPEASLRRAETVLEAAAAADPTGLEAALSDHPTVLRRVLHALCAVAPFMTAQLRARPERLLALARDPDLARPVRREELEAQLEATLSGVPAEALPDALRRFKYDALARITVREASPELVPLEQVDEVLAELSALAELLLQRALTHAATELEAELGPPEWRDEAGQAHRLGFVVLGLGKLGGGELNYSSDVDLVYVHGSPPPEAGTRLHGPGDLAPAEYFSRLAVRFARLVEEIRPTGFLLRIDLELRPEGSQGALVSSSDALVDYYDGWAATWEKAAFMKARPVAGDLALGWRVARAVDPMIYSSSVDLAAIDAIREMKRRVEKAHTGDSDRFSVKLGVGGIRDVEFIAQALQLLHGGRVPQVRGRSAPRALDALAEVHAFPSEARDELLAAYRFLRRVENRIQMEGERQAHTLPVPGPARERLARTLFPGEDASARLERALAEYTRQVRHHFEALFPEGGDERVRELFARAAPRLLVIPESRAQLEALASRFATEIEHSADPERAYANLERFAQGLGPRSGYYALLADRPELVPRLVTLFAASRTLSGIVARLPELIEPLFDDPLKLLLSKPELREALQTIRSAERGRGRRDEIEAELAALRLFQQRELVNIGLLDLSGAVDAAQVESALTELAEVCLEAALELAHEQLARSPAAAEFVGRGAFLVVGMGKLGSRELGYGSDLDVIFLYELGETPEAQAPLAQEAFVRLAQKLAWALQTPTAEGICYEVDARLRPSGNQGMLVTSIRAFERYHRGETGTDLAAIWERQALLRARPVVGSPELARRFEALRGELLMAPLPEGAAAEIDRIRARMEDELAIETAGRRNLKTGRGGLLDVETACQWLQLAHGAAHPELLEAQRIPVLLHRLHALRLLGDEETRVLSEGWSFLQRLSSRLRIVENRSMHDLEHDRADLDSVARALGYAVSERTGTSRLPLLEDYARHTEAIRRVYEAVLGRAGAKPREGGGRPGA